MIFVVLVLFILTIITVINFDRINYLQEQSQNAELRAVTHFRKLSKIENILLDAEINKTPSVFTVEQIKEVIVGKNK